MLFISSGLCHRYGGSALSESALAAQLDKICQIKPMCPEDRFESSFCDERGLAGVVSYRPKDLVNAWFRPDHWLRKEIGDSDVVHINGHWRWDTYFLVRVLKREKIPYVLHPRGMFLVGHRKKRLKKLFNLLIGNSIVRGAAKIILLSRYEAQQLGPYKIKEDKLVVLPNGISNPGRISTANVSLPFTGRYFLYLGRIEQRKNLSFLVRAFSKYRSEGGRANLVFIGPIEQGYDKEIKETISRLELSERVFLLPPVYGSDKWAYMKRSMAVIYPSLYEPFGRVPFESVLAEAIPIVPKESGSAEYLERFLPLCTFSLDDESSLSGRLTWVEKILESGAETGLDRAKEWVTENLDWPRIGKLVHRLYLEISRKS